MGLGGGGRGPTILDYRLKTPVLPLMKCNFESQHEHQCASTHAKLDVLASPPLRLSHLSRNNHTSTVPIYKLQVVAMATVCGRLHPWAQY